MTTGVARGPGAADAPPEVLPPWPLPGRVSAYAPPARTQPTMTTAIHVRVAGRIRTKAYRRRLHKSQRPNSRSCYIGCAWRSREAYCRSRELRYMKSTASGARYATSVPAARASISACATRLTSAASVLRRGEASDGVAPNVVTPGFSPLGAVGSLEKAPH